MRLIKYSIIFGILFYAECCSGTDEGTNTEGATVEESTDFSNNINQKPVGFSGNIGNDYIYTAPSGAKYELKNHTYINVKNADILAYRYNFGDSVLPTPLSPSDVIEIIDSHGNVLGNIHDGFGYTETDGDQHIVHFKIIKATAFGAGIVVKKLN